MSIRSPSSKRSRHVTIDCRNPYTLSVFWADVLGYVEDPDNPNHPDDPEALIIDPTGRHPGLLFVPVPESKSVKNRIHLDLVPHQRAGRHRRAHRGDRRHARRRPPSPRRLRLGGARRSGGQRVLRRAIGRRTRHRRTGRHRRRPAVPRRHPHRRRAGTAGRHARLVPRGRAAQGRAASHRTRRATSPVRSGTTIAGLLKHLALVEDSWFDERFARHARAASRGRRRRGTTTATGSSTAPSTTPIDELVGALPSRRATASRAAAAGHPLDDGGGQHADVRSTCASPTSTSSRRRPATSATSTSCASTSTARPASSHAAQSVRLSMRSPIQS